MAQAWTDFGIGRLFEVSRDAVVLIDDTGHIVLWNRAATKLFGYSPEEAVGMNVDRLVPPEMRDAHHAGLARYARTGHGALIDRDQAIEVPGLTKDGGRIWVELALTPIESRGRRFALGTLRDVTERVKLRARREADQKQLEEAYRTLEAFAYVVGHDLKEPVRGMGAYLHAMAEETDPDERARLLERATAAHGDLQRFIEGLLDWSRTVTTPSAPETLRLRRVLRDSACSAQWRPLADERQAEVTIDEELPEVLATEALVCRVFGNLITNAIRHNPGPRPTVRVRSGDNAPPGMVEVLVEDDGPGFPHALLSIAHEEPRSLRKGFGLLITRRAVERLQGEMRLENRPEGGGRARIRLPAPVKPIRLESSLEERVRDLV